MYIKNNALASLLSSRICHDLASPLGAVGNGLELMELSGISRTPEFELTLSSIQNATAKLNFFRIAYGNSSGKDISNIEVSRILNGVYANTRCHVAWQITRPTARPQTKLMFLLIQCLDSAMPRGGTITATDPAPSLRLSATSDSLDCTGKNWNYLINGDGDLSISANDVQFELARGCLDELGITPQIDQIDDGVVITI